MTEIDISHQTLDLLESRLRRVTFALTGGTVEDIDQDPRSTAASRLRILETKLTNLASKSSTASQTLDLYHQNPSIFNADSLASAPQDLPPSALASLVLAHAQSYQRMRTQLSSLENVTIQEPAALVPLVDLQPQIEQVAAKQTQLALQVASLRARSAKLLETWYTQGVLNMSEHWADWEERLRDVEILTRRMEAAKKREDGLV